ncbi:FAD-dependent oxidoreductase [Shigella flexneri]
MIVGAGTIGLELAASATQRRCKVTVIELAEPSWLVMHHRPCNAIFSQRHQQAGVRILLNNAIEHVVDGEKVERRCKVGEMLQADVVIYGIGISANEQLAREANLDTANGIVIDEACRTCDPA